MLLIIFLSLIIIFFIIPLFREYFKNKSIPKYYHNTKGNIICYEEIISWNEVTIDRNSDAGFGTKESVSPRYFKPVIEYYYENQRYEYIPDFFFKTKRPDFDINFLIHFDPRNPNNAKHSIINPINK